jgi:hypothetical protein
LAWIIVCLIEINATLFSHHRLANSSRLRDVSCCDYVRAMQPRTIAVIGGATSQAQASKSVLS